jgi:hypothetical protein
MSVTAEGLAKFWLAQQRDTRCGAPLSNSPLFVRPMFANTTKRARMMVVCRCSVGDQIFSVTPSTNYEFDYLGQSTKGDLNLNFDHLDAFGKSLSFANSHVGIVVRKQCLIACF